MPLLVCNQAAVTKLFSHERRDSTLIVFVWSIAGSRATWSVSVQAESMLMLQSASLFVPYWEHYLQAPFLIVLKAPMNNIVILVETFPLEGHGDAELTLAGVVSEAKSCIPQCFESVSMLLLRFLPNSAKCQPNIWGLQFFAKVSNILLGSWKKTVWDCVCFWYLLQSSEW